MKLQNGTYTLHASAPGFTSGSRGVTVAGSDLTGIDVTLTSVGQRAYSVSGVILATDWKRHLRSDR